MRAKVLFLSGRWSPRVIPGNRYTGSVADSLVRGLLWQDAGKTTLASAAGHPVRVWTLYFRSFGMTADVLAPSDAARPLLATTGGKWFLNFDGVSQTMSLSLTGSTPYSVGVRAANRGANAGRVLGGQSNWLLGQYGGAGGGSQFYVGSFVGSAGPANTDWQTSVGIGQSGTATFYLNGAQSGAAFSGAVGSWGTSVWLGSSGGAGEFGFVSVSAVSIALAAWNSYNRSQVERWLAKW